MDPIHITTGDQARMGGMDITISLVPEEAKRLGPEASTLVDWMHTALWAMAKLRTGELSKDGAWNAITALDHRLIRRLEGIRDAAIRAHANAGGSVGDLALAMDVPRSTAQYRREVLLASEPSLWESWATSGGPQQR